MSVEDKVFTWIAMILGVVIVMVTLQVPSLVPQLGEWYAQERATQVQEARADLWDVENCQQFADWDCWDRNPYESR